MKRGTFWIIIWCIANLAALALLLFVATNAYARPYSEPECNGIAKSVLQFAHERDIGSTKSEILAAVNEELSISKHNVDSFIKTEKDAQMMRTFVDLIFEYPTVDPIEFFKVVRTACLQARKPKTHKQH